MVLPNEIAATSRTTGDHAMRSIFATAFVLAIAGGNAAAATGGSTPSATIGSSVFADLQGLGYDLGKFRPDYTGRFPYRPARFMPA